MKKSMVALSAIVAMSIPSFAAKVTHQDMMDQIKLLKAQIAALESKLNSTQKDTQKNKKSLETLITDKGDLVVDSRFKKLEKKVDRVAKTAQKAKAQSAGDNLKWNVDFRTQLDNINYKHANGDKSKNSSLMTNKLNLGMKYAADENSIFYGTLSYLKAFGDTANHSQSNTQPGYANFDWVTNENALDNTLKVKEAYWLYKNDSFFGNKDLSWTASVGRRPSTDGLGINLRADQKRKSPLSHTVNVEFDGASARFNLDKITGVEGMWLKFCAGRGLTNAKPRFQMDGADYAKDEAESSNVDMAGFIFVPYDDGQYSVHTNYARAWNMIGFDGQSIMNYGMVSKGMDPQSVQTMPNGQKMPTQYLDGTPIMNMATGTMNPVPTSRNQAIQQMAMQRYYAPDFKDVGDIDLATLMFKVDGIGDGISDFLDETTVFASVAMSKTRPNKLGMLGSTDSKTGHSFWIGANAPCPLSPDDARIGIEWNKGSKYWRSMTYGEDTMAGSKIAARGSAWEIYRHQQLTKALSFGLSYTYIKYDYTGSNSFFGAEGTPMTMSQARAMGQNPVEKAQDFKAYMRYRF